MRLSRRALLAASGAVATPRAAWAQNLSRGAFTHGVASGDPLHDRVMLWTRFAPASNGRVLWEIAEDDRFTRIAQRGEAFAHAANDFCVHVDAAGLLPGRPYFYRFLSRDGPSLTGRTCTAPADASPLRLALFSCANYGFGYFHAYGHAAARDDIDLAIHAGDYLYELPRGRYPTDSEVVPGRLIEPGHETAALHDYYQRYALYHTDPDLLALRQNKPICAIWDDHEIADNAWRDGALGHQSFEGEYADRIAAAAKAYFDWMPVRRAGNGVRLYRSLDWGGLARIVLLDTRLAGRDQQLTLRAAALRQLAEGDADALAAFRTQLDDPARSMLGAAQEAWLTQQLTESKARGQTWQIIAQQIVVGSQIAAPELLDFLPSGVSSNTRRWFAAGVTAGRHGAPWNFDAWDGYPAARARLLEACAANAANAVILGGDSHNCWLNTLPATGANRLAALEFAGGSVTSPGFERPLSQAAPGAREAAMRAANPNLSWCDLSHRGYGALTFTPSECRAEWVAFANVCTEVSAAPSITRLATSASAAAGPGAWSLTG